MQVDITILINVSKIKCHSCTDSLRYNENVFIFKDDLPRDDQSEGEYN